MNLKDITAAISEAENIPAGKVRKITKAFLDRVGEAVENGEKLQLPGLVFIPRTLPAREAEGDKPARPERKTAVVRIRKVKKDDNESAESVD
jgi:nucleoid DNA-binding protein